MKYESEFMTDEDERYMDDHFAGGLIEEEYEFSGSTSDKSEDELVAEELAKILKEEGDLFCNTQSMTKGFNMDVDIVMAIDCTGSMAGLIDKVKALAKRFHEDLVDAFENMNRRINQVRIKVIGFRDFYFDEEPYGPLVESRTFLIPQEQPEFHAFVDSLKASGGGDEPESGLEALHYAINNAWSNNPDVKKRRQIVVLFTDQEAHALDDRMRYDSQINQNYPEGEMPATLNDLYEEWISPTVINQSAKRMILFAPDREPYSSISRDWDMVVPCVDGIELEDGLKNISNDYIVATLVGTFGQ